MGKRKGSDEDKEDVPLKKQKTRGKLDICILHIAQVYIIPVFIRRKFWCHEPLANVSSQKETQ